MISHITDIRWIAEWDARIFWFGQRRPFPMSRLESTALVSTPSEDTTRAFAARSEGFHPFERWAAAATATSDDWAATLGRVALALVIFPHGAQHLMGWFGGYGFAGTYQWMTGSLGIPGPAAAFSIVFEFVAPLLLLVGIGGRLLGIGLAGFMLVAGQSHAAHGFFMNWTNSNAGEGFEYHVLAIALALTVAFRGSGAVSFDRWLGRRKSA
jgi:putative oxidoreductase